MSEEDRIAYLAGESGIGLDPAERADLDDLRRELADEANWVQPAAGLEQRIVDSVAAAAAAVHPRSEVSPRLTTRNDGAIVTDIARHRSRRFRLAILGVAAAIVVATGLAIGLTVGLSGNGSQAVAYSATLTGTQLEPSASGSATLTKTQSGWRIHVAATGLPRRDNGEYYEAWLKNAAGVVVPIGTFNEGADVTLWAGVPPSSFPTLTITRQTLQGGPASSGQVVLAGPATEVK